MTNPFPRLSVRQRQMLLLFGGGAVILLVLWVVIVAFTPRAHKPNPAEVGKPEKTKILNGMTTPGSQVDRKDLWLGEAARDVNEVKQQLAQSEQQRTRDVRELEQKNQMFERKIAELEKRLTESAQAGGAVERTAPQANAPAPNTFPPAGVPVPVKSNAPVTKFPPGVPPGAAPAGQQQTPSTHLVAVRLAPSSPAQPAASGIPSQGGTVRTNQGSMPSTGKQQTNEPDSFLPVGIAPAVLLTGLDAPTSGQGQRNPHPVLMRIDDNGFLPNRYRSEIKECFVVAAGYGDLSSERAYMRLELLSCVRTDGQVIEVPVSGSVYGEDGKHGVRGRLVSKQGAVLANALLSGFVTGLTHSYSQGIGTISVSPLGSTRTYDSKQALEAGLAQGFSSAADKLSSYYMALADKMHPIIEVDAGRKVDIVFTKGTRIDKLVGSLGKSGTNPTSFYEAGHPDD
jgi:conjugal transfer pilus assembly protein TraB